jgi:CheY-like chemotaxis protein
LKTLSVLIVEDDEDVKKILGAIVRRYGTVAVAVDGAEALERLEGSAYDLVILDLMLPKVNGLEVAKAIEALRPKPRLIVFSALSRYFADHFPSGTIVMQKPQAIDEIDAVIKSIASE